MSKESLLLSGAKALSLTLTDLQLETLFAYMALLQEWNQHYNLSAITETKEIVTHHILDSLAIAPYLDGVFSLLDVGTGAGLPGLILAIYFPDKHVSLLDSNGKKTRFLLQVKHMLQLKNIHIVQSRAENYRVDTLFDGIISRALGPIHELIKTTESLLQPSGHWYAMKGAYPHTELAAITYPYMVYPLTVPGLEASRHLIKVSHSLEDK